MRHKTQRQVALICTILIIFPYLVLGYMGIVLTMENQRQQELKCTEHCQTITFLTKIKLINELSPIQHQPMGVKEEINNYNVFDTVTRAEEQYISAWVTNDHTPIWFRADITSNVMALVDYNDKIEITFTNNENWFKVKYNDTIGFIERKYLSFNENEYHDFEIPEYSGFKSYMDYTAVTVPTSAQYQLLNTYGYTDCGFRKVNGRYCVAVGSYFNTSIGQYLDLILENGVVIECIMGDLKADIHTEDNNIFTTLNKCCSEFIVDTNSLDTFVVSTGNISRSNPSWDSPVKYIRVYNTNFFDIIGE